MTVPVEAVKLRAFVALPAFVTAPRLTPAALKVAEEEALSVRAAEPVPVVAVSAVPARVSVPPLTFVTVPVAAVRLTVPEVRVVMLATPPTEVVPPLTVVTVAAPVIVLVPPVTEVEEREPRALVPAVIAPVSRPVTVTELLTAPVIEPALTVPPETAAVRRPVTLIVPAEMPPVTVAAEPKVVLPAPESEASVMVPVEAVKFRALASVALALVTAPTFWPTAEIVALPLASSVSVTPDLKLVAASEPPLTVMPEVPAKAPETAVSVPPETSVAPLKVLATLRVQAPAPVLVTEVEPVPLSPIAVPYTPDWAPVELARVMVRAAFVSARVAVPFSVHVPEAPAASKVAPAEPTVKLRSVGAVAPTYCSVPPLNTRLAAALVAEPKLPEATPPLPSVVTLTVVPALIVVTPVKVLAPVSAKTPEPEKPSVPVPLMRLATVREPARLKANAALLTIFPAPIVPAAPPAPTCRVPAEMVVAPE